MLEWDSAFFGIRIARADEQPLTAEAAASIDSWCRRNAVDCLYFLATPEDFRTAQVAAASGYDLIDIRLTLAAAPQSQTGEARPDPDAGVHVRPATEADVPALRMLARSCHRETRFFQDPRFPAERREALYDEWIRRSCQGYADEVLVVDSGTDDALGYVSCHMEPDRTGGRIGLVGLDPRSRGRGIGQRLVNGALSWFAEHGARKVTVVTQGRNVPGQRLYQRCGFLTESVRIWYHKWFEKDRR